MQEVMTPARLEKWFLLRRQEAQLHPGFPGCKGVQVNGRDFR